MLEDPGHAAPVLLDTENLMRAFGYEEHDERMKRHRFYDLPVREGVEYKWAEQRADDWADLQRILVKSRSPEGARSAAPAVLHSLIVWAERETERELRPRESYGKTSDSAVIRLGQTDALVRNGFEHFPVPKGKNEADDAINRRIDFFRFTDAREVMVIGGEDGDIWLKVLAVVDGNDLNPIRFWLIMPPRHQADRVHRRLFETSTWEVEPGIFRVLTVDPPTAARRRKFLRFEYVNVIHGAVSGQRKREGQLVRATTTSDRPPDDAAGRLAELSWTDVLDRIPGVLPRPSQSGSGALFGPGEWETRARAALVPVFGEATAELILRRVDAMARWIHRDAVRLSSLLPGEWEAFVFISIYVPIRFPDWPIEARVDRDGLWDGKERFRRSYYEQRPGAVT